MTYYFWVLFSIVSCWICHSVIFNGNQAQRGEMKALKKKKEK